MEEIGIVKEISGPHARVAVQKQSACDSCPGGSVCKTMGGSEALVEALNQANASIGDRVKIVFQPYSYLRGTSLIYGVPSLMLIIGAVVGKEYLPPLFPGIEPDILSAIAGFGLAILFFIIMKFWMKRYEGKTEYMPVVEEIVQRS
ncbi:MAG: SoxR reducing system RseC family protein [Nitrospirales bacterium]|nr:SoxR reducing system RseC family protein [Nitrospirales bacterium]